MMKNMKVMHNGDMVPIGSAYSIIQKQNEINSMIEKGDMVYCEGHKYQVGFISTMWAYLNNNGEQYRIRLCNLKPIYRNGVKVRVS